MFFLLLLLKLALAGLILFRSPLCGKEKSSLRSVSLIATAGYHGEGNGKSRRELIRIEGE